MFQLLILFNETRLLISSSLYSSWTSSALVLLIFFIDLTTNKFNSLSSLVKLSPLSASSNNSYFVIPLPGMTFCNRASGSFSSNTLSNSATRPSQLSELINSSLSVSYSWINLYTSMMHLISCVIISGMLNYSSYRMAPREY